MWRRRRIANYRVLFTKYGGASAPIPPSQGEDTYPIPPSHGEGAYATHPYMGAYPLLMERGVGTERLHGGRVCYTSLYGCLSPSQVVGAYATHILIGDFIPFSG
jgi:hypothetical protein